MTIFKRSSRFSSSPIWPALLSGLVAPGLGQIANRDFKKGIFLLSSSLVSFFWFSKVLTERLASLLPGTPDQWTANQTALRDALMKLINQNSDMFFTFQILVVLIWGFGVVDAYLTARKLRLRTQPPDDENTNAVG